MNEVTQGNEFWNWMATGLSKLQQTDEQYFQWLEQNLLFTGKKFDLIDKCNSVIVYSALRNNNQLLTVFPDKKMSRPALLFATSLMLKWIDCSKKSIRNSHVLYFGSTIKIRNQLGNIKLKNSRISLDHFFPQIHLIRNNPNQINNDRSIKNWDPHLPQAVCIYSPLDPVSIIKQHSADWIAVDCEDKANLPWLQPLLEYSQLNKIPLVAWSQNPFSECVNDFKKTKSLIFSWPHESNKHLLTNHSNIITGDSLKECFVTYKNTLIKPIVIHTSFEEELTNAYKNLAKVSNLNAGRLVLDALRVGWSFLRTLESLPIPLNLYEAEVRHFWGLKQVDILYRAFLQFIEAVNQTNPDIGKYLEEAYNNMERVYIQLQSSEPPLWLALRKSAITKLKMMKLK